MIKKVFSATILICLSLSYSFSQNQDQEKWVDSVFQRLTLDQKLGQLFMVPAYSEGNAKHEKSIKGLIEKHHLGGIIFMQGSPTRQIQLTNTFQGLSEVPLLIAMDMEWGAGMRLDSTVSFPKQMTLGAIQNDSLIYVMGSEIARQMKILGVHMNFAPVVDINTNPENPVIGSRSFGSDKRLVTNKAMAYMKGLQENEVLACIKHFPGHGDTANDSHLTLPTLHHSKKRLDTLEMYPFKKLAHAGVSAIMTGHIQVPGLDSKKTMPASLSSKITNDILRTELKYNGLIITDALNMRAVSKHYGNGEAEVLALQAGNDILLFSEDIPDAIGAIKKELKKNRLQQTKIDESVRRILRAKYKAGLHQTKRINTENIYLKLNRPKVAQLSHKLFERSITVVQNRDSLLPIRLLENKYFASLSVGPAGEFTNHLDKYAPFRHYNHNKGDTDEPGLSRQLRSYDVVVVGIFNDPETQSLQLTPKLLQLLSQLNEETELVLCLFDSPYLLPQLENISNIIVAYENNEHTQYLLPSILFGSLAADGRLPVTVSQKTKSGQGQSTENLGRLGYSHPREVGMDIRVLNKIDEIAREAIADKATPGCQVLVAKDGKIVFEKSYGFLTYDSLSPVTDRTIYDIASITKVLATLQVVMLLEERGLIDLDKKISTYLPELHTTNKGHMIIRDILTHQAGLWPYLPFWKQTVEVPFLTSGLYRSYPDIGYEYQVSEGLFTTYTMQDSVWKWVKKSKLRDKIAKQPYDYKYSDMGYYILQRLIESAINQPMDEFLQQNIYDPMGMTTLSYLPLCRFPLSRIAPTENDIYFRKSLIYGMVHDQGAAMCGGVAGHAGLFSNATDLAKMMQMHLQDGYYGGTRYFQPGTIEKYTSKQYNTNRRGLGWDKPAIGESNGPTSEFASPKTFGHTGFTGTAVWADPEFNLIYIFLSNRIHPDASNSKLIKNNIRTRIQDVIYEAMWSYEQEHDPH